MKILVLGSGASEWYGRLRAQHLVEAVVALAHPAIAGFRPGDQLVQRREALHALHLDLDGLEDIELDVKTGGQRRIGGVPETVTAVKDYAVPHQP